MDTGQRQSIRASPHVVDLGDGRCRVTVAHHDPAADELWVFGGLAGADPGDARLERMDGGWWERAYELPRDVRTVYGFARSRFPEPGGLVHDPLNPQTHVYVGDPENPEDVDIVTSVLELPDAPPRTWSRERDVPRGVVEEYRLASERLGNTRRVYTYAPPGYDASSAYPLVLCFDGWAYVNDAYVPLPTVLDNLISEGRIPPLVAVLPDSLDHDTRMRELVLDAAFVEFLVEELLPWAHGRLAFDDDPARTVVAGSSAGGLAAAFAALRRPDRFGLVLSQSGAYAVGSDLLQHYVAADALALRFYLDVGVLETVSRPGAAPLLHANRHLRDVLVAKGYDVTYREFPGGHDYLWWRETVADGLVALLG